MYLVSWIVIQEVLLPPSPPGRFPSFLPSLLLSVLPGRYWTSHPCPEILDQNGQFFIHYSRMRSKYVCMLESNEWTSPWYGHVPLRNMLDATIDLGAIVTEAAPEE